MSKGAKVSEIAGIPVMTVPEVAKILGVSERTVRTYIADGKLRTSMIAGRRYITRENIAALVQGEYIQENK